MEFVDLSILAMQGCDSTCYGWNIISNNNNNENNNNKTLFLIPGYTIDSITRFQNRVNGMFLARNILFTTQQGLNVSNDTAQQALSSIISEMLNIYDITK